MGGPLSVDAQNIALDAWLGAGAAAGMPAAFEVAMFAGDPTSGGTELTSDGGYVRLAVPNDGTTWPGAADGATTSAEVPVADSTDDYSATATDWVLYDAADHTTAWFTGSFANGGVAVIGAGSIDPLVLTVFFGSGVL